MVTLVHGDDQSAARAAFNNEKESFTGAVVSLDAKVNPTSILDVISTSDLFSKTPRLIAVENLLAAKFDLSKLTAPPEDNLLFWEPKKLSPSELKNYQTHFPSLKIIEHKENPIVFKFLDSLVPGNTSVAFPLWSTYSAFEPPELVLVMLIRHFRFLLLAASNSSEGPQDWQNLAPWQKQKYQSLTKRFPLDSLKNHYRTLLEIDYRNKSGSTPLNLQTALELFILSL